jgi:tRNA-dihydrouridine synthase 3
MAEKPEDIGPNCYLFETYGRCPYGITCRFAKCHISETFENISKPDLEKYKNRDETIKNVLTKDLQHDLWKRRYDFTKSDKVLEEICPSGNVQKKMNQNYLKKKSDGQSKSENSKSDTTDAKDTSDHANGFTSGETAASNDIPIIDSKLDEPTKEKKWVSKHQMLVYRNVHHGVKTIALTLIA